VRRLNSVDIPIFERRVAFGIGTGLGGKDGLLLENGDFWLGTNELGFIALPAMVCDAHPAHHALLTYLQKEKSNTSIVFETILSGAGLQLLHRFLYPTQLLLSPNEIGDLMHQDKVSELTDLFAWYLGLFVATLQLSFMPAGGIWMTGGVLLKHMNLVKHKSFQAGIHALSAYLSLRNTYPLGILHHPDWALIGAAFYANKRLQLEHQGANLFSLSNHLVASTP
jgi:glucokinase